MAIACDYERMGPAFGAGGDALVFAGEVVEVQFALERQVDGAWVKQNLTGKAFAFRVAAKGGATPVNLAGTNDTDTGIVSFTISSTQSAALVEGVGKADYRWEFSEVTEAGRQVIWTGDLHAVLLTDPEASLPTPDEGAAQAAITRYTIRPGQPVIAVRYLGQKGASSMQVLIDAGVLPEDATVDDYIAFLQEPVAAEAIIQVAAAVAESNTGPDGDLYQAVQAGIAAVEAQEALSVAAVDAQGDTSVAAVVTQQGLSVTAVQSQQTTSVAAVAAAGAAVTGVGGTIDLREDAALAALAAREGQAIDPGGAIDTREDAAIAAVAVQQTTSVNAVAAQGTTSVAAVVTQQGTSITAVEAAGDEYLAAIEAGLATEAIAAVAAQEALSVAAVVAQQGTSITAVQSQQTTSVAAVVTQQTTSVAAVVTQQTTSVAAVVTQQGTSVAAVSSQGTTSVAAVAARETTALANIAAAEASGTVIDTSAKLDALVTDGQFNDYVGAASPAAGSGTFASASTFIFADPIPRAGRAYSLTITTAGATTVKVKRFTRSGNTLTYQGQVSVVVASSGVQTLGPAIFGYLDCQPGDYIGLYAPSGTLKYTTGTASALYYSTASDVTTTYSISGSPATTNNIEAKISIYGQMQSLNTSHIAARKFAALATERGVTLTLGAASPADQATTISTSSTFIMRDSNPEPGIVSQVSLYSKLAGQAMFLILQPVAGGGYTLLGRDMLTLAVGVNTYTVAGGTLPLFEIPRGCLFGVFALTASAITYENGSTKAGYYSITGEVTGAAGSMAQSYGREIQMQVQVIAPTLVRKLNNATPQYFVDLDITTTAAIPASAKSAGMSYSGGYAVSTTTGISSAYIESLKSSNNHRTRQRAVIQLQSADARVAIYRRPVLNLSGVDAGTVAEVDIVNNRIILYQTWGGSALPSTRDTKTLSTITLTQSRDYICELKNDKKQISFTITDSTTGVSDTLTVDSDAVAAAAGLCYGAPGVAVIAGTGAVSRITQQPLVRNPKLAIIGDSITEGSGTTQANAWANLVMDALSGSAIVCADGGTASDVALRQVFEILPRHPSLEYVLVLIGTNDATAGASGVTNWQTHLPLLRAACSAYGVTPIIAHVIPRNDANQTHVNSINTYIRAQGWRTVRMDLALSVGNDGTTWNASQMNDSLHPNTAGHLAVYNRVRTDVPELFDA